MNLNMWRTVALKWRTIDETVTPLSIVEEITLEAVKEIKDKGLIVSPFDFLNSSSTEIDDDGDWP